MKQSASFTQDGIDITVRWDQWPARQYSDYNIEIGGVDITDLLMTAQTGEEIAEGMVKQGIETLARMG